MESKYKPLEKRGLPYIPTIYRYLLTDVLVPIINAQKPSATEFNWGGGRLCGKTLTAFSFAILLWIACPHLNIGVYAVRKKIEMKKETFDSLLLALPDWYKFKINLTNSSVKASNFYAEVIGLSENKRGLVEKLGITRRNHDIQIVIFDEAWQFTQQDFSSIMIALGSGKIDLTFKLSNPYSASAPFFVEMVRALPFDLTTMKNRGHKIKKIKETYWHWVSPVAIWNEDLLNRDAKKKIMLYLKTDILYGEMYLWGKPVSLSGGVFTGLMNKARKEKTHKGAIEGDYQGFNQCTLYGGLDIGYSVDKTVLLLGAISEDQTRLIVIDEFVIDNQMATFDLSRIAFDIINFIFKFWEKTGGWNEPIVIYCDNDFTFTSYLGESLGRDKRHLEFQGRTYRLQDLVIFQRISEKFKKERILSRISGVSRALNSGKFHYVNAPNLITEMNLYRWDTTAQGTGKKKPIDKDNHSIDALSYLLRDAIYSIGTDT